MKARLARTRAYVGRPSWTSVYVLALFCSVTALYLGTSGLLPW